MTSRRNDDLDTRMLVAQERRRWRQQRLLGPASLDDFQELTDAAFHDLRRRYPAAGAAEDEREEPRRAQA